MLQLLHSAGTETQSPLPPQAPATGQPCPTRPPGYWQWTQEPVPVQLATAAEPPEQGPEEQPVPAEARHPLSSSSGSYDQHNRFPDAPTLQLPALPLSIGEDPHACLSRSFYRLGGMLVQKRFLHAPLDLLQARCASKKLAYITTTLWTDAWHRSIAGRAYLGPGIEIEERARLSILIHKIGKLRSLHWYCRFR